LIALRMMALTPHLEAGDHLRSKQMGAMLLVASALLTIALSFIKARFAMWGLALNFVQPVIARWGRGRIIPGRTLRAPARVVLYVSDPEAAGWRYERSRCDSTMVAQIYFSLGMRVTTAS
jgi:hypothetical protein